MKSRKVVIVSLFSLFIWVTDIFAQPCPNFVATNSGIECILNCGSTANCSYNINVCYSATTASNASFSYDVKLDGVSVFAGLISNIGKSTPSTGCVNTTISNQSCDGSFTIDWNGFTNPNGGGNNCAAGIDQGLNILPVLFGEISLSANSSGYIEINWETLKEVNNEEFAIERSYEGNPFEKIGSVPGAGNSDLVNSYTFVDRNPPSGLLIYRILQRDFDGLFSYSTFKKFNNTTDQNQIFYNSATRVLKFYSLHRSQYFISNMSGQIIASGMASTGDRISLTGLPQGLYLVVLKDKLTKPIKIFIE